MQRLPLSEAFRRAELEIDKKDLNADGMTELFLWIESFLTSDRRTAARLER
jgi:hypothetical protein